MALDTKRLIGIALGGPSKASKQKSVKAEPEDDELDSEMDDEEMMDYDDEEPSDEELDSELPGDPLLTRERLRCADDAFKAIECGDRRAFVEAILAIADQTEY